MKMRGVIISLLALVVFFTAYAKAHEPEPEKPSTAAPVMVPYLNKTISEVIEDDSTRTVSGHSEEVRADRTESRTDHDYVDGATLTNAGTMETGETLSELVGEETDAGGTGADPVLNYIGNWTITFYCPCELCCGVWATGCTASGVLATEWHTVATDMFPFGTELYVDGLGYFVVEDLGVTGEQLDVFVNDHETALNLGLQYRDVYIVED